MMRASKTYFEVREKKTKELKSRLADSVFDGLEKRVPFHLRFGIPQDSASCSVRLIGAGRCQQFSSYLLYPGENHT